MSTIGFIGLGNMGLPMAMNLAAAGHDIKVYDISNTACVAATNFGLDVRPNLAAVVSGSEFIITMLTSGAVVHNVLDEIIPVTKQGSLIIDCSTIDMSSSITAHKLTSEAGLKFLDSPVSGGITGAEAGSLTLMVGGDQNAFNTAQPVLDAIAEKIVYCGKGGSGQAAKICNNMLLGITMIGLCESLNLADNLKLSRQALFDVVSTSSGSCWSINHYCPLPGIGPKSPADNDYLPGFSAALMLKDLHLSQQAADETHTATPLGIEATQFYKQFVASGMGDMDFSAVINTLRQMKR